MKQTLGFTIRMPSVRCFDAQFAFNALGGVALREQLLLRPGLGPHVRWECGYIARIAAASNGSSHARIVWSRTELAGSDRQPRLHRLPQDCILFGRTGWAGE